MHFSEAKGILSARGGMNIYRGCTHGCIYCDSRSRCYQINHDFEDIEVKRNAPELLEQKLSSKRKKCMIGTGAMCDPYMHCEAELGLMRRCLEIIKRRGFGVTVQTKSDLILRDINIIEEINAKSKAVVQMTLTTADKKSLPGHRACGLHYGRARKGSCRMQKTKNSYSRVAFAVPSVHKRHRAECPPPYGNLRSGKSARSYLL